MRHLRSVEANTSWSGLIQGNEHFDQRVIYTLSGT